MGHPQALTAARARAVASVALLSLLGCAQLQFHLREPGEVNRGFPEEVAAEYDCAERSLPFFQVELDQLVPDRVAPGHEFNHRLQYVVCPVEATQVVRGTLHTRILFRGEAIHAEASPRELLPGRWVVDEFIRLPSDARPGIYALQSEFESPHGRFDARSTFLVEP